MKAAPLSVTVAATVRGGWLPAARDFRRWAAAALGRRAAGHELSVLLVGERRSRALNGRYRGRHRATNVLSFPATAGARAQGLLGDLVLCPSVLRVEARRQRKRVRAHWAHLVVHGVLHLLGYDHEQQTQAARMERRERQVLRRLGIADPYRRPPPPVRAVSRTDSAEYAEA
jgi:probable rRNA maturation factor